MRFTSSESFCSSGFTRRHEGFCSRSKDRPYLCRGVLYVHWVMHKCIIVKVGGKRYTQKVCKKQVNLSKTGGNIFKSRGEIIIFAKQGGKCTETGKTEGKFEIFGR